MQTSKISLRPTMHVGNRFICGIFAAVFLMPLFCWAQSQPERQGAAPEAPTQQDAVTPADSNAMILSELESMRKRIEQLEAQLKAQSVNKSDPSGNRDPSVGAAQKLQTARENLTAAAIEPAASAATSVSSATAKPEPTAGSHAKAEPFAFADFTWLNGNPRTETPAFDSKFFTPEIRADVDYIYDFNHPKDDTIGGSSEVFRANEVQLTQLGVGGDFHYDNVRARFMTQFGMYSTTTPRNDASSSRGQWNLANAYRYLSEAYGGYHFNAMHGINVDAGIFMSYIGLFSYYNFDNWAYQPSYVSSNTPWFFNGVRVQFFLPTS